MLYYNNDDDDDYDDDGDDGDDEDDDDVNQLSKYPRDQLEAFYVYGRSWNRLRSGDVNNVIAVKKNVRVV